MMVTFKGTDKDMKCHGGFQYELGKKYTDDGAIRCGSKGFHSCKAPLDVLSYFHPKGGAATAGDRGAAASRGSISVGENGVGTVRGNNAKARGGLGAILTIAEENEGDYDIKEWKTFVVDGEKIKADTWYKLVNGELVEVDE